MHPYATNQEKTKVFGLIAVLSTIFAYLLSWGVNRWQITIPWMLDAPSVIGFFGILYAVFNLSLWKTFLGRLLVATPDLNGKWKGHLVSSFNQHETQRSAELRITQTWTHINIIMKTSSSSSHSRTATISTNSIDNSEMTYEYTNEPKSAAASTMNPHRGTAYLTFSCTDGMHILEGEYYTGRGRQNFGSLYFEKMK